MSSWKAIIGDDERPILAAVDEEDRLLGYAFCIFQQHIGDNILTDIKTLYIDDLCVDEKLRGQHIGSALYEAAKQYARGAWLLQSHAQLCGAAMRQR